jgi:teichuronic acid biosynthesis glycosyltransferase TuaG
MTPDRSHIQVSIITPNYNGEAFIAETIQSVLNQDFVAWELIIIDDNSGDESIKIIESFHDDRIQLVRLDKNQGAAIARNEGIRQATGRWIAFLDGDDVWMSNKLSEQISFMRKNNYAFTYTAYEKVNEHSQKTGLITVPEKVNYHDLLKTCSIGCLTAIYDSQQLGKIYMPEIDKRQDYGLWLKILKQIDFAYGMDQMLAKYRVRSHSISRNKFLAAKYQWRVYREIEKLSFFSALRYMISYAYYGTIKSYLK